MAEAVMINGGAQGTMRLDDFARTFTWADDKYPMQTGLREMVDEIMTVRHRSDASFKQQKQLFGRHGGRVPGLERV